MTVTRRNLLRGGAAASAVLAAPAVLRAQNQVFTLSSWLPRQHLVPYNVMEPWIEIVGDITRGRVQIEFLEAPAGPPPAHYDIARSGAADIVYTLHGYSGDDAFPRSQIGQFSFLGDSYGASIVFSDIYGNTLDAADEHEGVQLLGLFTHGPGVLFLRENAFRSINDLEGLRIRNPGGFISKLVTRLGGETAFLSPRDVAPAFEAGDIDGATFPFEAAPAFGFADKVRYGIEMPGGIYNATWMIAMNPESWGRISDRDQAAILQISNEVIGPLAGKAFDDADYRGRQLCIDAGMTVERASDELIADLAQISRDYEQEWIRSVRGQGYDGAAALDTLRYRTDQHRL